MCSSYTPPSVEVRKAEVQVVDATMLTTADAERYRETVFNVYADLQEGAEGTLLTPLAWAKMAGVRIIGE
jgi:hypothetical protein